MLWWHCLISSILLILCNNTLSFNIFTKFKRLCGMQNLSCLQTSPQMFSTFRSCLTILQNSLTVIIALFPLKTILWSPSQFGTQQFFTSSISEKIRHHWYLYDSSCSYCKHTSSYVKKLYGIFSAIKRALFFKKIKKTTKWLTFWISLKVKNNNRSTWTNSWALQ